MIDIETFSHMLGDLVSVAVGYGCQMQAKASPEILASVKLQTQERMQELIAFAHSESIANGE